MMYRAYKKLIMLITVMCMVFSAFWAVDAVAADQYTGTSEAEQERTGGGYAATGQISGMSYTTEIYDAQNGLPTSDAMCICSGSDGHIFIGGYSGVICYNGSKFERLDSTDGLTSARDIYEDSKGRIWVGTNDNGVILIEGEKRIHYTYEEGLPSSSIRAICEDGKGNIYIGTISGMAYITVSGEILQLSDSRVDGHRIMRLGKTPDGRVYGLTSEGDIFLIKNGAFSEIHGSNELGMKKISSIIHDPESNGKFYMSTDSKEIYYGDFGAVSMDMKRISIAPIKNVEWLSYSCGRVFVMSSDTVGYLDESDKLHILSDIKLNSGIERMISDYQGNLWFASSKQGVMKLVSNNFIDLTEAAGINKDVVNAVCLTGDSIHIGSDSGYTVLNMNGEPIDDELCNLLKNNRIRCITKDSGGNIWVSVYTNGMGLVKRSVDGRITRYTGKDGLPSDEIRCTAEADDGSMLVGTNEGLAVIKNGKVIRTYSHKDGMSNSTILTVAQGTDGKIYMGTDGGGLYIAEGDQVARISREDGLTSDVVLRVKNDPVRDVVWAITSNSIQYFRNGSLKQVSGFPYSNNYDIYFDEDDKLWILSSLGLYVVKDREMLSDAVDHYDLYTVNNGLPYAITGNSFSAMNENGEMFIAGRQGVIKTNVKDIYAGSSYIKTKLEYIDCDGSKIYPDDEKHFTIPSDVSRVKIVPDIFDYSVSDPPVHIYLDGVSDEGVFEERSKLSTLEYTNLPHGVYELHIKIYKNDRRTLISENTYKINKIPRIGELLITKLLLILLAAILMGLVVWHTMNTTIIRRQYEEIRHAKDEAERANSAKTRFLANITHELRTPINTIMGMDEMILREDAKGVPMGYFMSIMNYAMDIRNASESLLSIINDFLDISRVESGKMQVSEQSYDLQELLRSVVSMIKVRSTEKELTFDVVVDEILPKQLLGDSGKIKEIILNLLTNAVKYTEKGGFILQVSMNERKDDICKIVFSVKDTGIGIKPEDQDRLFTAYERLDQDKNINIMGTGLGLDISKRFAELMNGTLVCKSTYGKGSEFIFTVTQKILDAAPMGVFLEHDDTSVRGAYVPQFIAPDADVLVVDDTPMNLSVIKGLLKPTKIFVTTATSGEECLEKLKETKFNIVLLDHMMPGMDGIETVEKIREDYPELPVYVLTANAALTEEYYISRGFNGRLSKPVDSLVLEKTIMKHLPDEMMQKPTDTETVDEPVSMPDNMMWIYETDGIDAEEGIKNSGGISNYIFALKLFYETIDENSKVIKDAFESRNIRLYTIKVHALKSSARIIGALALSQLAARLEAAGDEEDLEHIEAHTDMLLSEYETFKGKLQRIEAKQSDSSMEPVPEEELRDAYEALKEIIPQMDYDSVEMIVEQLGKYKLPDTDAEKLRELAGMLKKLDWDGMEEMFCR